MTIMTETLSLELVKNFVESADEFPVDFDDAWRWIGYSRKDNAKTVLIQNFEINLDFLIFQEMVNRPQGGGRYRECIKLTVDCFKSFCMMSGTSKGREVRQYFLQCEKQLKQLLQQPPAVSASPEILSLLGEMSEVIESHIQASQALNRAIHTAIHQQTDTLRNAFQKTKALHQKTLSLPYFEQPTQHQQQPQPQLQPEPLTNLVQLTPRLTSREKREAVNLFLNLIEDLPPYDERRRWSSRQIGKYLGVSNKMVLYIKQEREGRRQPPKYTS
ncbi:hypothetical protein JYQ62_19675 [Nostoc sp. UHCC 0702]|nr:hypothetical protein JYQ62_19675 [Nostoc sp. UHCC 0702]